MSPTEAEGEVNLQAVKVKSTTPKGRNGRKDIHGEMHDGAWEQLQYLNKLENACDK